MMLMLLGRRRAAAELRQAEYVRFPIFEPDRRLDAPLELRGDTSYELKIFCGAVKSTVTIDAMAKRHQLQVRIGDAVGRIRCPDDADVTTATAALRRQVLEIHMEKKSKRCRLLGVGILAALGWSPRGVLAIVDVLFSALLSFVAAVALFSLVYALIHLVSFDTTKQRSSSSYYYSPLALDHVPSLLFWPGATHGAAALMSS